MQIKRSSNRALWTVAGIMAAIALLIFGLTASGVLKLTEVGRSPNAIQAKNESNSADALRSVEESTNPNALSKVEGTSSAPTLNLNASRKEMPEDVRKWLEHLERCENKRGDYARAQLGKAMSMMIALQAGGTIDMLKGLIEDPTDEQPKESPAESTKADIDEFTHEWSSLRQEFNSLPPPAECVPIRDSYDTVLAETSGMILEIVGAINNAEADRDGALAVLMGMQGKSKTRIDEPARKTDRQVGDVCRKYETYKWFGIASDVGGGVLNKLGF